MADSLVVFSADTLQLGAKDVLEITKLTVNGSVVGYGEIITNCQYLRGRENIAETITITCSEAIGFSATAISPTRIRVTLFFGTTSETVDIRRRLIGSDTWETIASDYEGTEYYDDYDGDHLDANIKYEYQWRYHGEEIWSDADPAWLTRTWGRTITVEDVISSDVNPFEIVTEDYVVYPCVDCEEYWSSAIICQEFVADLDEYEETTSEDYLLYTFICQEVYGG